LNFSNGPPPEKPEDTPTPDIVTPPRLLWTDLASSSANYEEVPFADMEKVVGAARSALNAHNVAVPNKAMELHLFGHAVERILATVGEGPTTVLTLLL
jgi:hypothetical protein